MNPEHQSTQSIPAGRWRARLRRVPILLVATFAIASAQADPILLAAVIAGGGATIGSPGGCYRADVTVGQPALGRASAGAFTVDAGYWAGRANRDSVFHHGFEVCS